VTAIADIVVLNRKNTEGGNSMTSTQTITGERADLLATLRKHRGFLLHTVKGLTDGQARLRPTASELTLGGLIKHVARTEEMWIAFTQQGAAAFGRYTDWQDGFRLVGAETLDSALEFYASVADTTDKLVATVDLDQRFALPPAPWFAKEDWSTRRVLLHVIAETSQHAGHADILRESIDGAKTMG
jgi:uncharacterized damage-inducible protein DinB